MLYMLIIFANIIFEIFIYGLCTSSTVMRVRVVSVQRHHNDCAAVTKSTKVSSEHASCLPKAASSLHRLNPYYMPITVAVWIIPTQLSHTPTLTHSLIHDGTPIYICSPFQVKYIQDIFT